MSEPFSPEISDRICSHMNQDHPDAVLLYAQSFDNSLEITEAVMDSIDAKGMSLTALKMGYAVPIRIEFDRDLKDAEDAHQTLIEMLKQARQKTSS